MSNNQLSKHTELTRNLRIHADQLKQNKETMDELAEVLGGRGVQIKRLQAEVLTKVSLSDFQELHARFDVFSDMETIKQLNETFLPKIKKLHAEIGSMDAKAEDLQQCILQFDNNLSLKANKSAMQ